MKYIGQAVLGIWCALASFVSPIWLTLTFLYITGGIYKYDYSIDDGVGWILGVILFTIWGLFVLLPDILFLRIIYMLGRKCFLCACAVILLLAVMCTAMCGWDIVRFLTVPGGMKFGF